MHGMSGLVGAHGDAAPLLELAEAAFDDVAATVAFLLSRCPGGAAAPYVSSSLDRPDFI
jgi:hypothetical protein